MTKAAPALTVVASKTSRPSISEDEAVKRYATHLENQSWCVDVTALPYKAFHAESRETKVVEDFVFDFGRWAAATNVRVDTEDFSSFLRSLEKRLMYHLPRIVGTAFVPTPKRIIDRNGVNYANRYVPFAPTVPDVFVMPDILEEYLSRVFMNDQDRKYITEWMADIIQNPLRRPQWGVIMTGKQGCGKSTLHAIVRAALGNHHVWDHNEYTPAFEKFSEVVVNYMLLCFDDAPPSRGTYAKLKHAITRKTAPIEIKGKQERVERDVYARILICSNIEERPLVIEKGDRRLYVAEPCDHRVSPEETAEFFARFAEWLDLPDTPTVLYHWLKSIDLTDFVPGSTIKTEAHAKMVGLSASVLETLLAEYVKDSPIFHVENLVAFLAENGCPRPLPDLLKMQMAKLGYEQKRRTVTGCGAKQYQLWQRNSKRSRPLTTEEEEQIRSVISPTF